VLYWNDKKDRQFDVFRWAFYVKGTSNNSLSLRERVRVRGYKLLILIPHPGLLPEGEGDF
jgi:hypothetical protein